MLDKIKLFFLNVWKRFALPLVIILTGVIIWVVTGNGVPAFIVMFVMIGGIVLFVMGRQLWWRITKTGDYEDHSDED